MPLKYPDLFEHNNPTLPIVNIINIKGNSYPLNFLSDTGSIPIGKRNTGTIIFVSASQQYYGFYGNTTGSSDWDLPSNWRSLGGNMDTGSFATTGSNIFIGNQIITGSLTVSGAFNDSTYQGTLNVSGVLASTDGVWINNYSGYRYPFWIYDPLNSYPSSGKFPLYYDNQTKRLYLIKPSGSAASPNGGYNLFMYANHNGDAGGIVLKNFSSGTSAGIGIKFTNDANVDVFQNYVGSSASTYGSNTIFIRNLASGSMRFVSDRNRPFTFGTDLFGASTFLDLNLSSSRSVQKGITSGSSTFTAQFHDVSGTSNTLVIRDDRRIGILKSSPNAELDVNGNVIITGSLTVTQGITGSLEGTSSWSQNSLTSSYVVGLNLSQISSDYVTASVSTGTDTFSVINNGTSIFNIKDNNSIEHGINVSSNGLYSYVGGEDNKSGINNAYESDGSISNSIIVLKNTYGDVTSNFIADDICYFDDSNYGNAYGKQFFTIKSSTYDGGLNQTTVQLYESSINSSGAIVGGLSSIETWNGDMPITGSFSYVNGKYVINIGNYTVVNGIGTIAISDGQTVIGKYNTPINTSSLFVIGNGTDSLNRSDLAIFNSNEIKFNVPLSASFIQSFVDAPSGSINYIPKFSGSTTIENSIIYESNSKIGIDTTDTIEKLTVNGSILSKNSNPLFILRDDDLDNNALYLGANFGVFGGGISYGTFAINRNPATGNFFNTGRAASQINLESANSSGVIRFYTTNINNDTPALAMGITPLRNIIIGPATVGNEASARLQIRGSGATSSTTTLLVENSNASASFVVRDDNRVAINKTSPNSTLDVNGNTIITGSLTVTQGITGSLNGTSSWSTNSITASFAPLYVLNSVTSSMLSPYLLTSVTSSMLSPYMLISSSSLFVGTGSFNSFTSSINTFTSSINNRTSSFATTGSNIFIGDQTITGSLRVTGSGNHYVMGGNVGIGTATPAVKLEVVDASGNEQVRLTYDATRYWKINSRSDGGLAFTPNSGTGFLWDTNGALYALGLNNSSTGANASVRVLTTGTSITRNIADTNPALIVNQASAGAASTGDILRLQYNSLNRVVVDYNGNVGVGTGTNTILGRVHVRGTGSTASTTTLRIENSNASASLVVLDNGTVYSSGPGFIPTNTVFGSGSMLNPSSSNLATQNVAVGYTVMSANNMTGYDNVGIGFSALQRVTTGYQNMGIGTETLQFLTTGLANTAVGHSVLRNITSNTSNVGIGHYSLFNLGAGQGNSNTSIGASSFNSLRTGSSNIGLGGSSGNFLSGSFNIFIGAATHGILTGSGNVIIGNNQSLSASLNNTIALSDGNGNLRMYVSSSGNIGFGGFTAPNYTVDVSGSLFSRKILVGNDAGFTGAITSSDYYQRGTSSGTIFLVRDFNNNNIFTLGGASATSIANIITNNIGLGTSAPTAKVQIRGNGATVSTTTLTVENSTPSSLLTIYDNGQQSINSPIMTLSASGSGYIISQSISQSAVIGAQVYGVNILPVFYSTTASQTETAFRVNATYTGSAAATLGTNIIADFGSTTAGSQLTVTDVTSGSIYMVNDVSGLPIIEATSDWGVKIYDFPRVVLEKTGSNIIITGSLLVTGSLVMSPTSSFVLPLTASSSPQTGSAYWSGSFLFVWNGSRYMSSSFS